MNDHDEQRPDAFDLTANPGADHGGATAETAVTTEHGAVNGNGQIEDFLRTASASERDAFFASFDQMLQENMARSRALLQQAMTLPTVVDREVATLRAEADARLAEANAAAAAQLAAERDRSRLALTALQTALTASRQQAEQTAQGLGALIASVAALSERAAAALADLDTVATLAGAPPADQTAAWPAATDAALSMAEPVSSAPEAAELNAEPFVFDGEPMAVDGMSGEASESTVADTADGMEFAAVARLGGEAGTAWPDEGATGAMTIIVHGVHHAISVLSFKRHLARLRHVESVAVKEYADGVLNLQVTARKPLTVKDLQSWEGGAGLEITNAAGDAIEARLPEVAKV